MKWYVCAEEQNLEEFETKQEALEHIRLRIKAGRYPNLSDYRLIVGDEKQLVEKRRSVTEIDVTDREELS